MPLLAGLPHAGLLVRQPWAQAQHPGDGGHPGRRRQRAAVAGQPTGRLPPDRQQHGGAGHPG
eukprot:681100-Alexandrium_andersonii.AAC.1